MNEIEQLKEKISKKFTAAKIKLDKTVNGWYWLYVGFGGRLVEVVWIPKKKEPFGVSDCTNSDDTAFSSGHDKMCGDVEAAFQEAVRILGG